MKPSCLILPLIFTFFLDGFLMWHHDSAESSEFDVSAVSSAYRISLENLNQEIINIAQEILREYPQWIEQFSKKIEEIIISETPERTSFTREEIVRIIHQYRDDFIQRKLFLETQTLATTSAQIEPLIESTTSPSTVIAFRLYEYDNKKPIGIKKFSGNYRLLEANIAQDFLKRACTDRDGIVYIEDPNKAGVLVPELEIATYKQYLEKVKKYHQKFSIKKLIRTLACLRKSTPPSILINYIIATDIIGLEDFIVTRPDALAIIEFVGLSHIEAQNFLVTASIEKPELCVNGELDLFNVHILKTILEQTLTTA